MKYRLSIVAIVSLLLVFGCATTEGLHLNPKEAAGKSAAQHKMDAAIERDNIFMLLAYAVVFKDWQDADNQKKRGYNIGAVLVDPEGKVVFWARNSVNVTGNRTQHGEVRLINCYLAQNELYRLKGYTIYTSLEPCAMCSGMMMLTKVFQTVYGQTDPGYGDAIERLEMDSRNLSNGYPPYPRHVESDASKLVYRYWLDFLYSEYRKTYPDRSITEFLVTEKAREVYKEALQALKTYRVQYKENEPILKQVLAYYKQVSDQYTILCPPQ